MLRCRQEEEEEGQGSQEGGGQEGRGQEVRAVANELLLSRRSGSV